jgi:hypothetical protein
MQLTGCGSYAITQHSCPRRPVTASLPQRQARPIYVYVGLFVGLFVAVAVAVAVAVGVFTHTHTHTDTHRDTHMGILKCSAPVYVLAKWNICACEMYYMCLRNVCSRNVPYVLSKCILH